MPGVPLVSSSVCVAPGIPRAPSLPRKAIATWQWFNYVEGQVPVGKTMLRVNLDETAVCLFQGGARGTIFASKKRVSATAESASLSTRRRYMTHVGLICDRPDLQPLPPQFLIGNERTFLATEMVALQAGCPPNVKLVRQKSAWLNAALCRRIVRALKVALAPHLGSLQIVLVMDTARVHVAALDGCRAEGVWTVFVPARLTWLLQPLDTNAFGLFKFVLQQAYQRARASSGERPGRPVAAIIQCVCDAVRRVLQGHRWADAFDGDGYGQRQARLSARVKRALDLPSGLAIPSTRPSAEQIGHCFPRRARLPLGLFWAPFDAAPAGPDAAPTLARGRGRGRAARGAAGLGRGGGRGGDAGFVVPPALLRGPPRTRSGIAYSSDA